MCATTKTFSSLVHLCLWIEYSRKISYPLSLSKVGTLPRISTMQLYMMISRVHFLCFLLQRHMRGPPLDWHLHQCVSSFSFPEPCVNRLLQGVKGIFDIELRYQYRVLHRKFIGLTIQLVVISGWERLCMGQRYQYLIIPDWLQQTIRRKSLKEREILSLLFDIQTN